MSKDLLRYNSFELRHLRLVLAVAEARSLTHAASRLRLTTSALSHQLRQLESLAGAPMFLRDGRTMRATRAGEMVLDAAKRALTVVHETEERLRQREMSEPEIIRLCTHCFTGYAWLPSILASFMETHPGFDVRISSDSTRRPFEALRDRKVDLVLALGRPLEPRFTVQPLFRDDLLLLVAPDHRLAARTWVSLEELQHEHLILHPAEIEESAFFAENLVPRGIRPQRFTGIMLTEAIVEMVKAGLGVTVLPRWMAADLIRDRVLAAKRLTRGGLFSKWYAITRKKSENAAALETLIAQIAKQMASRLKAVSARVKKSA